MADARGQDEDVALGDGLPLLAEDLADRPVLLVFDRDLHINRLEDDHGVAVCHLVADRDLDFPHVAGDVRLDVRHGAAGYPPCPTLTPSP